MDPATVTPAETPQSCPTAALTGSQVAGSIFGVGEALVIAYLGVQLWKQRRALETRVIYEGKPLISRDIA